MSGAETLGDEVPSQWVPKKLDKTSLSTPCTPHNPSDDEPQKPTSEESKVLSLSYVCLLSENLDKFCTPFGIKAVFKPTNIIRQFLVHVKKN